MRIARWTGMGVVLAAALTASTVLAAPAKKSPREALEEFKRKIEEAKGKLEAQKKHREDVGQAFTGKFKVQYNYGKIKTNLGGKTQVMTFSEFKQLRIPIGRKGVPVSPKTIENIKNLPRRIIMESNGFTVSIRAKDGGKVGGLVNAKEKTFGITALNGALITGAGAIVSGGQVKGELTSEDPSRIKGTVGFGIGGVAGGGSGGVFVAIPFRARKVK